MIACFLKFRASCLWLCAAFAFSNCVAAQAPQPPSPPQDSGAAIRLTLQDAIDRARKNSTVFRAATTEAAVSREDKNQARDALLPSVAYNTSAIYSQGNGAGNPVRFIANNGVHEYVSQANVHQVLDVASFATYRAAAAAASAARARAEIASRGLVVTVVRAYYATLAAQNKLESARKRPMKVRSFS